jgi:hypothetical protein
LKSAPSDLFFRGSSCSNCHCWLITVQVIVFSCRDPTGLGVCDDRPWCLKVVFDRPWCYAMIFDRFLVFCCEILPALVFCSEIQSTLGCFVVGSCRSLVFCGKRSYWPWCFAARSNCPLQFVVSFQLELKVLANFLVIFVLCAACCSSLRESLRVCFSRLFSFACFFKVGFI